MILAIVTAIVLTVVLSGPVFWCWGHAVARVRVVAVGPTREDEEFLAAERARVDQLLDDVFGQAATVPPCPPDCRTCRTRRTARND